MAHISDISMIKTKYSQDPRSKREVTLVDDSGSDPIALTLWQKHAEAFTHKPGTCLAFKHVRVVRYGKLCLAFSTASTFSTATPAVPTERLRLWWQQSKRLIRRQIKHFQQAEVTPYDIAVPLVTVAELQELEPQLLSSTNRMCTLRVGIVHVKSTPLSYPACPRNSCRKKAVEHLEGQWRCPGCNDEFDQPKSR